MDDMSHPKRENDNKRKDMTNDKQKQGNVKRACCSDKETVMCVSTHKPSDKLK